jgi:thiamine biosynthesis lipoprotein
MGTVVSIEVDAPEDAVERAFEWFRQVEACCSRFDASSELRQLTPGSPVAASPILFEAVRFALLVAQETDGAFDPTIGSRMAARGFNRHYVTGETSAVPGSDEVSFRDVVLDANERTILLRRPLTLDLGAVAKGLAVDAAARELQPFRGEPWRAGVRHPRLRDELVDRFSVSDRAVCTSGDYERGAHILDPRDGGTAQADASATVVAPSAMLADALATAAFVLGPEPGIALLTRMGVEGLIVTPDLERFRTQGFGHA